LRDEGYLFIMLHGYFLVNHVNSLPSHEIEILLQCFKLQSNYKATTKGQVYTVYLLVLPPKILLI
jgi:hypothetical protein